MRGSQERWRFGKAGRIDGDTLSQARLRRRISALQITPLLKCRAHPDLALFTSGKVMVMRWGGGLGESKMGATSLCCSSRRAWPGNKEQQCPSGPMPSRSTSNAHSGTSERMADSYAEAACTTRENSKETATARRQQGSGALHRSSPR